MLRQPTALLKPGNANAGSSDIPPDPLAADPDRTYINTAGLTVQKSQTAWGALRRQEKLVCTSRHKLDTICALGPVSKVEPYTQNLYA